MRMHSIESVQEASGKASEWEEAEKADELELLILERELRADQSPQKRSFKVTGKMIPLCSNVLLLPFDE